MAATMFTHLPVNSEGISGRDLLSLADQTFLTTDNYLDNDGQWSQMSPASPMFPSPFGDIGFLAEGMDPCKSFKKFPTEQQVSAPRNKLPPSAGKTGNQTSLGQFFDKVREESKPTSQPPKRVEKPDEGEGGERSGEDTNSLALSAMTPPKDVGFYNKRESTFDTSKQSLGLSALHSSVKTSDTTTTGKKISFAGFPTFHASSKSDSTKRTKSTAASTKISLGLSSLGASRSSSNSDDKSIVSKARNFNFSVGEKFTNLLPDIKQFRDNTNWTQKAHQDMVKDEKDSLVKTLEKEHVAVRQENELLKAKLEETLVRMTKIAGIRKWFTVEELAVVTTKMTQAQQRYQQANQDREHLEKILERYEALSIAHENCIWELEKSLSAKDEHIANLEARLLQNGLKLPENENVEGESEAKQQSDLNSSLVTDNSFSLISMADDINSCVDGSAEPKPAREENEPEENDNENSLEVALSKLDGSDEEMLKTMNGLAEDLNETLSEFSKLSSENDTESPKSKDSNPIGMKANDEHAGLRLDEYMHNVKPSTTTIKLNQSRSTIETETWAEDPLGKSGFFSATPTPVSRPKSPVASRTPAARSKSSGRARSKSPGQVTVVSTSTRRRSKSPSAGRPRSKSPALMRKQLKAVIESESTESTSLPRSDTPPRRRLKNSAIPIEKGVNQAEQAGKDEGNKANRRSLLCRSQSMVIQRARDPPGSKVNPKPIGRSNSMGGRTRSNSVGRASRRTQMASKLSADKAPVEPTQPPPPPPPPPPSQPMSAKSRLKKLKKGSPTSASSKTRKTLPSRSKSDDNLCLLKGSSHNPKKDELRGSSHNPRKDELRSSSHNPRNNESNKRKTTTADIKMELESACAVSEAGNSRKIKFTPHKKKGLPNEG